MANWGPDAAEFRPERWFEKDADYLFGASDQQQAAEGRGCAATGGAQSAGKASAAFEMGVVRSASTQVALAPWSHLPFVLHVSDFSRSHTELSDSSFNVRCTKR